jgi:hypothetical protein
MGKPLVYIDQNVIGLILEGQLNLSKQSKLYWVYSKEHFAEIRRSTNVDRYLSILESIDAKLLDLELNSDWKITGAAQLIEHGTPIQHYKAYIEATGEVDSSDSLFDPFQVWVNGGGDEGPLKELPEKLSEQVLALLKDLPVENDLLCSKLENLKPEFSNVIEQMIEQGNDISKTRMAMGDGNGAIGGIYGENQLQQIWEIIGPVCPGISCDQFFGFDPISKQGYESWPVYLGIIGCCAVMDIVGFQAEKKCRRIEKLPNVRSDANHIAMGAFCSAILSEDRRLIKRAKAIYAYKGIGTTPLLIEKQASKSMQPITNVPAD